MPQQQAEDAGTHTRPPAPHPPRQLLDLARNGGQALHVCIPHNGHHQAQGRLRWGRGDATAVNPGSGFSARHQAQGRLPWGGEPHAHACTLRWLTGMTHACELVCIPCQSEHPAMVRAHENSDSNRSPTQPPSPTQLPTCTTCPPAHLHHHLPLGSVASQTVSYQPNRFAAAHLHRHGAVHGVVLADEVGEPAGVHLGHLAQRQGRGLGGGGEGRGGERRVFERAMLPGPLNEELS